MRTRLIAALVLKDLTETLRDRRTLFMMVLMPILLYPMVIALFGMVMQSRVDSLEEKPSRVAVLGELPSGVISSLEAEGHVRLESLPALEGTEEIFVARAKGLVPGQADAVLAAEPGLSDEISSGAAGKIWVYYDSVADGSAKASKRVEDALGSYREQLVTEREQSLRLPAGFSRGVDVVIKDVAVPERKSGQLLGSVIPILLLMMSLMGAFYPAIDLTAGEKERGTVETLLCAPIRPMELILGKFAAVSVIAMLSAAANLLSIAITTWLLASQLGGGMTLRWQPEQAAAVLLLLAPTIVMMSALFLAIAVVARDFKDGQNLLTPVFTVIVLAASAALMPGIQLGPWTSFVPVVNMVLLIRVVMVGEAATQMVFAVLLSSAVWAGLALLLASRVFRQEQLLLGGGASWSAVFAFRRTPEGIPTSSGALLLFAVILPAAFYGSVLFSGVSSQTLAILGVQLLGILLPTLLLAAVLRVSPMETFSLRLPSPLLLVPAALMGVTVWLVTSGLVLRVLPPPESYARLLEKVLSSWTGELSLPALILMVAALPAVVEELAFRGVIMRGLSGLGAPAAIGISAILFGLAHADLYRLIPATLLGVLNGWVVWRTRSIFPAMVIHFCNNAGAMVLGAALGKGNGNLSQWFLDGPWPSWPVVAGAIIIQVLGILWIARLTRPTVTTEIETEPRLPRVSHSAG